LTPHRSGSDPKVRNETARRRRCPFRNVRVSEVVSGPRTFGFESPDCNGVRFGTFRNVPVSGRTLGIARRLRDKRESFGFPFRIPDSGFGVDFGVSFGVRGSGFGFGFRGRPARSGRG